jgi:hypothetical protein
LRATPTPRAKSGASATPLYPFAWTYRDYVIKAFNDDKPYDRFIIEQIAADKLPLAKNDPTLAAMGFLTLGERFQGNENDIINDRIDVVTKGLLGLSVSCARCHDHKFDPIPTKDYYALRGVFSSSYEPKNLPLIGRDPTRDPEYADYYVQRTNLQAQLDHITGRFRKGSQQTRRELLRERIETQNKIDALELTHPGAPARANVLFDSSSPKDSPIFIRGEAENKGSVVPRQFLECISGPNRKPFTIGSGRIELANAIASKANPLTARVMVNRIWQHHFGEGIVSTPDDFGAMGSPPTHSGAARLPRDLFHGPSLVGETDAQTHPALEHLPAKQRQQRAVCADRSVQPPPLAAEHPPPGVRAAARFSAGYRCKLDTNLCGSLCRWPSQRAELPRALLLEPSHRPVVSAIPRAGRFTATSIAPTLPEVFNHFDFANPNGERQALPDDCAATGAVPHEQPLVVEQARNVLERRRSSRARPTRRKSNASTKSSTSARRARRGRSASRSSRTPRRPPIPRPSRRHRFDPLRQRPGQAGRPDEGEARSFWPRARRVCGR